MRHILNRLQGFRWKRFVPLIPLLMGWASCDLCGSSTRWDGTNRCTQYDMVSAIGFPYGPVTVSWTPTDGVTQYMVEIWNQKNGIIGYTTTDISQTSAVVTLDKALIDNTLAGDGLVTITGAAALSGGVGNCEFDVTIGIKKKPTATPTATLTPAPPQPQPPKPPKPPKPTATPRRRPPR